VHQNAAGDSVVALGVKSGWRSNIAYSNSGKQQPRISNISRHGISIGGMAAKMA